jgi:hypothetical protein
VRISRGPLVLGVLVMLLATACIGGPSPSASPRVGPSTPEGSPSASPSESPSASAPPSASPTATPEPPLSLEPPETTDERVVSVSVVPDVGEADGTLTVTVTSAADTRIDEIVLRWPTGLEEVMRLAPFAPSEQRISDTSPPLVQDWTKWVFGPGEQGEPAGTISVGWGPLLPDATLEIPLVVTRTAAGAVAFDLQLLSGNDLLTFEEGDPAELRVEVP